MLEDSWSGSALVQGVGTKGAGIVGGLSLLPLTGLPVLLTNMELGLWCQELQWLLQREKLSLPKVQPGFCLYLSTTLPLCALEKGETQREHC